MLFSLILCRAKNRLIGYNQRFISRKIKMQKKKIHYDMRVFRILPKLRHLYLIPQPALSESLRSWQFLDLSRTNFSFLKPEMLLSCSQGPGIKCSPEPFGSSPNPHPISLTYILIIILLSSLYFAGVLLPWYLPIPNPVCGKILPVAFSLI
jgi:hypothetical protein